MRVGLALGIPLVTVVLTAGCTAGAGESSPSPNTATSSPRHQPTSTLPSCKEVWRPNARLPDGYSGCTTGSTVVPPALLACKDGGSFTSYRDLLYAVTGRRTTRVNGDVSTDLRYARAYSDCLGQADGDSSDEGDQPSANPAPATPAPTTTAPGPSAYQDGHIWLTTDLVGLDLPEVRAVQSQLNTMGFSVVVDGSYGPQTAGAVREFQRVYGLTIDGVVGPETYTAMFQFGD
jgi:hypothetical protein